MRRQNNYAIMSVRELADVLAREIDMYNVIKNPFYGCDFAMIDPDIADEIDDIERYAKYETIGWYGIKSVDPGFDSTDLLVISDRYGGGGAAMATLWNDMDAYDADPAETIMTCILQTLNMCETAHEASMLIVEFSKGAYLAW